MYKTYPVVSSIHKKAHKKYLSNYAFRSVFPVVSQHLKASSDKKGEELGVFTASAASRKASVCGAQWELRVTTASAEPHEGETQLFTAGSQK